MKKVLSVLLCFVCLISCAPGNPNADFPETILTTKTENDTTVIANQLQKINFSFDQKITDFNFVQYASGVYAYAQNEKADMLNDTTNAMYLMSFPLNNTNNTVNFIKQTFEAYARKGIWLQNTNVVEVLINNQPAFIAETEIMCDEKKGMLFVAMIPDYEKQIQILFSGFDYTTDSHYLKKYQQTVTTIKGR